jgi:hypothetical protein
MDGGKRRRFFDKSGCPNVKGVTMFGLPVEAFIGLVIAAYVLFVIIAFVVDRINNDDDDE